MKIEKAINFAVEAHQGQLRKGTYIPYVFHPIDVGKRLAQNDASETLVVAGILHDVLEDTKITLDELKAMFGDEVAALVLDMSEPDKMKPWKERKTQTITYLRDQASMDVKILECADKLGNITDIFNDLDKQGDKLWTRFNAGYEEQKWYYQELVKSLESLSENKIYIEFCKQVKKVFG